MTSLILGLLLAAPPSPAPPTPRMEKLTRILAGEDRRDFTADVRLGLGDADRGLRRRAALAAGRIGDPPAVPPPGPLPQDPRPGGRPMTGFPLRPTGDAAPLGPLPAALQDPQPGGRRRA